MTSSELPASGTTPATARPLSGSERAPAPRARAVGGLDPGVRIEVTVVLRRRAPLPPAGARLTREQLARGHGADPADVELAVEVLTAAGLEVVERDPASRRLRLAGTADALQRAFDTRLEEVVSGTAAVPHRQREGPLSVPAALDGLVVAVLGLDDRPQARAHFHVAPAAQVARSFTPLELGEVYAFPAGLTGAGRTLAIIELGGGYTGADLEAYFTGLGLDVPAVRAVGVDGAANAPEGDPGGADGEVLLDIEVAGALAPGADIVVLFAPNTDAGFLDAVSTAALADPTPTAISISWGQSEDQWTAQARAALDEAMADAAALGVTVTAAAGDDGSSDRQDDGRPHVDFPASSPHALACGGTRLQLDDDHPAVRDESVWNAGTGRGATGGGVSRAFPLPAWQRAAGVPSSVAGPPAASSAASAGGRGVPDVAAVADPATGYDVLVDGRRQVVGGTSAVSPLWAALACRFAEALDAPLGLLAPLIYAGAAAGAVAPGFRDITAGDNGDYAAGPGWDACTGLGVPDGTRLLAVLRAALDER